MITRLADICQFSTRGMCSCIMSADNLMCAGCTGGTQRKITVSWWAACANRDRCVPSALVPVRIETQLRVLCRITTACSTLRSQKSLFCSFDITALQTKCSSLHSQLWQVEVYSCDWTNPKPKCHRVMSLQVPAHEAAKVLTVLVSVGLDRLCSIT